LLVCNRLPTLLQDPKAPQPGTLEYNHYQNQLRLQQDRELQRASEAVTRERAGIRSQIAQHRQDAKWIEEDSARAMQRLRDEQMNAMFKRADERNALVARRVGGDAKPLAPDLEAQAQRQIKALAEKEARVATQQATRDAIRAVAPAQTGLAEQPVSLQALLQETDRTQKAISQTARQVEAQAAPLRAQLQGRLTQTQKALKAVEETPGFFHERNVQKAWEMLKPHMNYAGELPYQIPGVSAYDFEQAKSLTGFNRPAPKNPLYAFDGNKAFKEFDQSIRKR
jgi:hypothetical protein